MLPVRFIHPRETLLAWDPFRQFDRISRLFDACDAGGLATAECGFAVDVREEDGQYVVEANLPGLDKDAVDLTLEDSVLTISGETRQDKEYDQESFRLRERRLGKVSRSFRLPDDVDAEKVEAAMANGVLTVRLSKAKSAQPRKIDVRSD